jgi:hypothetical protein
VVENDQGHNDCREAAMPKIHRSRSGTPAAEADSLPDVARSVFPITTSQYRRVRRQIVQRDWRTRPACHIDFRYHSARACQRRGVNNVLDLLTLDPVESLPRDLRFNDICWKLARKRLSEQAHRFNGDEEWLCWADLVNAPSGCPRQVPNTP